MPAPLRKLVSILNLTKSPTSSNPQLNESSGQAKPNTVEDDAHDSEALLAFRTITTMLSLIQSPTEVTNTGQKDISRVQHHDLRVLDALSAVIVREHEVAAVMAKPYNGASVEVFASVNNLEPPHIIPQQSQHARDLFSLFRQFIITPNPRDPSTKSNLNNEVDSLTTQRTFMTVVDPNPGIIAEHYQPSIPGSGEGLLDMFLQFRWGSKRSFDTHIWMLKTLLGISTDLKSFDRYVIAASFPKMLRRLDRGRIPMRYFKCLLSLEEATFEFIELPDIETTNKDDHSFLSIIPSLKTKTDISNLKQMAGERAKKSGLNMPTIYNKNTYMEFHRLLCEFLRYFHSSLTKLENLQSELRAKLQREPRSIGHNNLEEIKAGLEAVSVYGRHLRAMVKGPAIKMHLKTIAHLLDVDKGQSWTTPVITDPEGQDGEDGEDAEFRDLKPYSMYEGKLLLPWESYRDWLKLTTLYFDAITILRSHVKGLPLGTDIEIKILAPSRPQGLKMLPWKKLLLHEVYFPKLSFSEDPKQTSAEDLITFLTSDFGASPFPASTCNEKEVGKNTKEKGKGTPSDGKKVSIEEVVKSIRDIMVLQENSTINVDDFNKKVSLISDKMMLMSNCSSPGWQEYSISILDELQVLNTSGLTPQQRLVQTRKVLEKLETLKGSSSLYQRLKEDTALSLGYPFHGSRHCEVCIATLASLSGQPVSHWDEIAAILPKFSGIGEAIGVSKRCCPVCAYLLKLLKTHDGKMFVTTGEHSKITSCTLPEWLPVDIIEQMAVEFGRRLRKELVKLQQSTEVLRRRVDSTDTRRISLDSIRTSEEGPNDQGAVDRAYETVTRDEPDPDLGPSS